MSAMVASAAQAEFHSSVEHTIVKGSQVGTHNFTVGEGFGNITTRKRGRRFSAPLLRLASPGGRESASSRGCPTWPAPPSF
jgi:hypothetical protein